jgi:hypothetical protein
MQLWCLFYFQITCECAGLDVGTELHHQMVTRKYDISLFQCSYCRLFMFVDVMSNLLKDRPLVARLAIKLFGVPVQQQLDYLGSPFRSRTNL